MDEEPIDRLILDALYYRRATPGGSSFVSNVAGLDLLKCDSSALEPIERALRAVVVPFSASRVPEQLLGLDYVLGAYAIIGSRYDPGRVVAFVRTMPMTLQAAFIAVLPIFFDRNGDHYNFGVAPVAEFLAFVDESVSSDADPLRTAAKRAVSFLTAQTESTQKC